MRYAVVMLAAFTVALVTLAAGSAYAAGLQTADTVTKAATDELPLAFKAVGGDASQVLDQAQAEQVRGQWWIYIQQQAGDIFFYGVGSGFTTNLYTESESYPGYWVGWRITIGQ